MLTYLKATIISGYKFWRFRGFVDLAGINFSDFELKYLSRVLKKIQKLKNKRTKHHRIGL